MRKVAKEGFPQFWEAYFIYTDQDVNTIDEENRIVVCTRRAAWQGVD